MQFETVTIVYTGTGVGKADQKRDETCRYTATGDCSTCTQPITETEIGYLEALQLTHYQCQAACLTAQNNRCLRTAAITAKEKTSNLLLKDYTYCSYHSPLYMPVIAQLDKPIPSNLQALLYERYMARQIDPNATNKQKYLFRPFFSSIVTCGIFSRGKTVHLQNQFLRFHNPL